MLFDGFEMNFVWTNESLPDTDVFVTTGCSAHLYAGEVSVLSCHMDGRVPVLIHFVQRDGLFLHELKQPQQDFLLDTQTDRRMLRRGAPSKQQLTRTQGPVNTSSTLTYLLLSVPIPLQVAH